MGTRLNRGHPLAKGLAGCWVMNEGAGALVSDSSGLTNLALTGATWSRNNGGIGTQLASGTTNIATSTFTNIPTATIFSLYIRVAVTSYTSLANIFSFGENVSVAGGASSRAGSMRGVLQYSNVIYFFGDGADWATLQSWDVSGALHDIAFTSDGTTLSFYYDGRLMQSTALPAIVPLLATETFLTLGLNHSSGTVGPNAQYNHAYIYNRALSASEVMQLYLNPYQMLQSPTPQRFYSYTAGGSTGVYSTDNAISTDTFTLKALYSAIDTAAQIDNYSLNSFLLPTETGTGTDSVLTTALYAALDAGNLTDAAGLLVTITSLESGGASESGGVVNGSQVLFGSDAGTWSDTVLLSVLLAIPDAAVETELNQLAALFTANDTGAGSDTFTRLGTLTIKTILTAIRKRLI